MQDLEVVVNVVVKTLNLVDPVLEFYVQHENPSYKSSSNAKCFSSMVLLDKGMSNRRNNALKILVQLAESVFHFLFSFSLVSG